MTASPRQAGACAAIGAPDDVQAPSPARRASGAPGRPGGDGGSPGSQRLAPQLRVLLTPAELRALDRAAARAGAGRVELLMAAVRLVAADPELGRAVAAVRRGRRCVSRRRLLAEGRVELTLVIRVSPEQVAELDRATRAAGVRRQLIFRAGLARVVADFPPEGRGRGVGADDD